MAVLAACVFGIVHDLLSTQVCLEYFTLFHPRIIESENPIALALAWGVVATWWMGVILGFGLASAAVVGPFPPGEAKKVAAAIASLLWLILGLAVLAWVVSFTLFQLGLTPPLLVIDELEKDVANRMGASYVAHNVSYIGSAIGAMFIGVHTYQKRQSLGRVRPE